MKRYGFLIFFAWLISAIFAGNATNIQPITHDNTISIPSLKIDGKGSQNITKAYRIAIGDIAGNIQDFKSPGMTTKKPCLYAGLVYDKPWTRDTSINIWNGFCFLSPTISKNTLLAQLYIDKDKKTRIDGQYWDKVIWCIGAWQYYLSSGDTNFLKIAYNATKNTIPIMERDEFSLKDGLFRGPAVYGDGVAAYPKIYTTAEDSTQNGTFSGIADWVTFNLKRKYPVGYGLPMYVLSTNTVYYETYVLLRKMALALNEKPNPEWMKKADKLRSVINKDFWNTEKGNYRYLLDLHGNCEAQEGMGISLSLLFGIPTAQMKTDIFAHMIIQPAGIPCLYPCFPRYYDKKENSYGRHCGTVWPHIQGFWADASAKNGKYDSFMHEFNTLTQHAVRDNQFVEIYHPLTGLPYGGLQEPTLKERKIWFSGERQTWSATSYLRMIFYDIVGISLTEEGLSLHPFIPKGIRSLTLSDLKYRNSILDITVKGAGSEVSSVMMDNRKLPHHIISANTKGIHHIVVTMHE